MIHNLPSLSETLDKYRLRAKKSFGQNFLLDLNITQKIARAGGADTSLPLLEIGPGPGGLTRALFLEGGQHVIAVEKDRRFLPLLQELQEAAPRLEVIEADATKLDITTLKTPLRIIANLPYNVGTLLLINWLHQLDHIDSMTLLFQKEVAERLVAKPGSKNYGRLSVLAQLTCTTNILFDIPKEAFTPPPKVTSTLVKLIPREDRPSLDVLAKIKDITQFAFGQRRKMLRASLKPLLKEHPTLLADLDINPEARGETLSPDIYLKLAKASLQEKK